MSSSDSACGKTPAQRKNARKGVLASTISWWQGLVGLSCRIDSFLESIQQSLVFGDQLWASLSPATLNFK
jgi:hypothetical protein